MHRILGGLLTRACFLSQVAQKRLQENASTIADEENRLEAIGAARKAAAAAATREMVVATVDQLVALATKCAEARATDEGRLTATSYGHWKALFLSGVRN